MKRRNFGQLLAGGAIGAGAAGCEKPGNISKDTAPEPKKKALMYVGLQRYNSMTEKDFQYLQRHGVNHYCARVSKLSPEGVWDIDEMKRMKDLSDKNDVSLENLYLGLTSGGIDRQLWPNILLGKRPERDREIEIINGNIKKTAEVGISSIQYDMTILPIMNKYLPPGRGGTSSKRWALEENWEDLPISSAGRVPLEVFWERITYFLERVIPVAEEYKVRMAVHTPDPPTPIGYRGVDRWDTQVFEGLKRYVETVDSPYNGLLLCIGSASEGLMNPATEILEIVRYFGERKKLFLIHYRNIIGKRYKFYETFPDEGDLDMYKIMKVLRDVEYPYMIMPDHAPTHPDDPERRQAFAFCIGYIKAMIQAVNSEV